MAERSDAPSVEVKRHKPTARSPIRPRPPLGEHAGWEVSLRQSVAPLRLSDLSALSKVEVRTSPATALARHLGVEAGRAATDKAGRLVVRAGPDRYLILGRAGISGEIVTEIEAAGGSDGGSAVADLTHGLCLLRLSGPSSAATLEKICAIDLSDKVTPDGASFRSAVARVVTDVVRHDQARDGSAERSYLLACERSLGQYLFESVLDAGSEFVVDVDGFGEGEI